MQDEIDNRENIKKLKLTFMLRNNYGTQDICIKQYK